MLSGQVSVFVFLGLDRSVELSNCRVLGLTALDAAL